MKGKQTAIFIHGGAIKGAFGAGFVYGLSKLGVTTADLVVGASSGVATASYFTSKQFEIIREVWTKEIAKEEFVKYSDVFTGKPAFNLDYLINTLFKGKYPLDIEAILQSKGELRIPLCHYPDHSIKFFSNRGQEFKEDFWNIFHTSITMHEKHILWGTKWEPYADPDLDPFALYRQEIAPKDWNILVINNHYRMGNTLRKWLGLQIFLLIQARHFPTGAKEMLFNRTSLIRSGIKCFEKFKEEYAPLVILPKKEDDFGPASVIQRNNDKLNQLFAAGEKAAQDMRPQLDAFIRRSAELTKSQAVPTSRLGAPNEPYKST